MSKADKEVLTSETNLTDPVKVLIPTIDSNVPLDEPEVPATVEQHEASEILSKPFNLPDPLPEIHDPEESKEISGQPVQSEKDSIDMKCLTDMKKVGIVIAGQCYGVTDGRCLIQDKCRGCLYFKRLIQVRD